MVSKILFFVIFFFAIKSYAQNLGGSYTYAFLKLSNNATTTSLGGPLVALQNADFAVSMSNPALLTVNHNNNFYFSAQQLYGGISNLSAAYVYEVKKWKLPILTSLQYLNYGKLTQTNAAGVEEGNFNANDFVLSIATSKNYLNNINFGTALKVIGNQYGIYKSYAIATDVGLNYLDTSKQFQIGLLFKNIGIQLKAFVSEQQEPLPFDLQLGISKKLKKAPIQFIATITNAHQFDIRYTDTLFDQSINANVENGKFTIDKLFRHLIIGTQIAASKNVHFNVAYNYLRRKELGLFNIGNSLTGLSFGAGINIKAYQFSFANSFYFNNKPFHQIGVGIDFKKLMIKK